MSIGDIKILIKGGGDLGSACAIKLFNSGFQVFISELPSPMAIRRLVSFSSSISEKEITIEGVKAVFCENIENTHETEKHIPVLTSAYKEILENLKPEVIVDCTLKAIDNRSTFINDAPFTVGLGNGFRAPGNISCVIETNRGHNLGKIIWDGETEPYTGTPGSIKGEGITRLLRAPSDGVFKSLVRIGDSVLEGQLLGWTGTSELKAGISGILRGIINDGARVKSGMKIGDIDPRGQKENAFTISDKARCIAGGVLEAVMIWYNRNHE